MEGPRDVNWKVDKQMVKCDVLWLVDEDEDNEVHIICLNEDKSVHTL